MEFPFYLHLGEWQIHPHPVFEALAYLLGFRLYLALRKRGGDPIDKRTRWFIIIAAICGSAFGSKVLFWVIDPALSIEQIKNPAFIMGGKTIVGALIGGTICVELTKRAMGVTSRTGDLFALPLCLGIVIGRIGCFLAGLEDATYGVATLLPWGVDFGDGIPRHPTQLYEIGVALLIGCWVLRRRKLAHTRGDLFLGFLLLYLAWRLGVEFIKPGLFWFGLTSIQWACLLTLLWYARRIPRVFGRLPAA